MDTRTERISALARDHRSACAILGLDLEVFRRGGAARLARSLLVARVFPVDVEEAACPT